MKGVNKQLHFNRYYTLILFGILIGLVIVMSNVSTYFLTKDNILNLLNQLSIDLIISLGTMFAITARQTDLSIGSIIGVTGLVTAMVYKSGIPESLALVIGLAVAIIVGLINGLIISFGKVDSFIITLAVSTILRGIILVVTQARPYYNFGPIFRYIGTGEMFGVKVPVMISFTLIIVVVLLFNNTRIGKYFKFIGSNEIALHRSGVNVNKYKILIFVINAFFAGIAGLIMASRLNSAEPLAGQGYEIEAISIVVLGGTNPVTGNVTVLGTLLACFIINIIENGLILVGVSTHYQRIITGVILIIAVIFSETNRRRSSEI
ncbi:ABC transporter permease [Facklamia hominis]|uniref:ABC transporter permease n=1 Tax=Facklamia hominis TaxID=178214 RepID=UPI0038FC7F8B